MKEKKGCLIADYYTCKEGHLFVFFSSMPTQDGNEFFNEICFIQPSKETTNT